jgi:hypothetical protein
MNVRMNRNVIPDSQIQSLHYVWPIDSILYVHVGTADGSIILHTYLLHYPANLLTGQHT